MNQTHHVRFCLSQNFLTRVRERTDEHGKGEEEEEDLDEPAEVIPHKSAPLLSHY